MMCHIKSAFGVWVRWPRLVSCSVLLLLTLLVVGCEDPGMLDLIAEMAVQWAAQNKLVTVSENGDMAVNWVQVGIYQGQKWWNGTTGNRAVDAALDVGPIAHSIYQADKLAQEGMKNRDPSKLDEAIAQRPGDWNYHDQKAAILAVNGDEEGAQAATAESEALVAVRIREGGSCRGLHQNMLRGRQAALQQQLQDDPDNPILLRLLEDTVDTLHKVNTNHPDSPCK